MWPGMKEHFAPDGYKDVPFEDIQDRLTFVQSLEAVRCLEEGVVNQISDANIGLSLVLFSTEFRWCFTIY